MENLKIGQTVYFDETSAGIIQLIDEFEKRVSLKWVHIEDEFFHSAEPKLISKHFRDIRLTF